MRGLSIVALAASLGIPTLSCGGSAKQLEMGPTPPRESSGTFAGATCQSAECSCRSGGGDGGVGVPEREGMKRFEIRLSSPYELWASVPGSNMYKDKEKPEKCFYVDLAPGSHTVRLRAEQDNGLAAQIRIQELGTKTQAWYETFGFRCGNPGPCTFEELDRNKAELQAATEKNVYDKCGSVKVKDVVWDTGKSPDQTYPSQLIVQFTLQVYKFQPDLPPGDPNCGKRRPKEAGGDEPAEPTVTPAPAEGSATPSTP